MDKNYNATERTVRLPYMDIAKGIGILCVIIGHMGNETINRVIFSFHMPLFFLISGYFLSNKLTPKEIFVKRVRQLIKPYIYTCIAVISIIGFKNVLKFFMGRELGKSAIKEIIRWIYASLYGAGTFHESPIKVIPIGAIWFLLAMIWGTFMTQYARTKKYPTIWIVGIALIGYFSSKFIWLPWSIQAAMTATVFIYMGTLLKEKEMLENNTVPLFAVSLLIWINEIIHGNPNLSIVRNFYPNGVFDFIGGGRGHINYFNSPLLV